MNQEKVLKDRKLKLLNGDFVDTKTKADLIDENGYKYSLSFDCIRDKRTKRFNIVGKSNKFSIENIQLFIKNKNCGTKVLSKEYVNNSAPILMQCECGNKYTTTWNHIYTANKIRCTKCGHKIREDNHRLSVDEVQQICSSKGYILLNKDFKRINSICVQDEYGYKYKTNLNNIKMGATPIKFHKRNPFTIENMCLYINENNIPVELVNKSNRTVDVGNDYLDFYCSSCGNVFSATWSQITINQRYRCPDCVQIKSNLENIVEKYLIENNIQYEYQKRFDDCRDKRCLPFDFYLPCFNTVIEVNGSQHYYENKMFWQSLKDRQRVDKIKKDYCRKNNINFLELPFWYIINSEKYKELINNITK